MAKNDKELIEVYSYKSSSIFFTRIIQNGVLYIWIVQEPRPKACYLMSVVYLHHVELLNNFAINF
jgi:hypothetical protein